MNKKKQIVTPIVEKMTTVRPTEEESAEIRALQKTCDSCLAGIGDLEIKYITRKKELIDSLSQTQKSLVDRSTAIATAHGINLKEGWNLDTAKMIFNKRE